MKIALDYDGTFTRDPALWMNFIKACHASNHDIRIVTMRNEEKDLTSYFTRLGVPVIFTSLMQKREYCDERDWHPDVWIDDSPEFIVRRDVAKFLDVFNPKQDA
jgi:hypothetical protein